MNKIKNVAKYSFIISLVLILSKFLGSVQELLIATQFGANRESDIFKVATRIPYLFYGVIAAALTTTFIPIFTSIKEEEENDFFNNLVNIIIIICIIIALLASIFSKEIIDLMVSGFKNKDLIKASQMSMITIPSIIFLTLSGICTGYLQSKGKFLYPTCTSVVANIIIIVSIVFFSRYGIIVAVIAFLISAISQVVIQIIFMKEYKYKFYINLKDPHLKQMVMLSIPILISTAASQINVIVDTNFASKLAPGSISIMDIASRISTLINQVFIVSITTVFFPLLTEKYLNEDKEEFNDLFGKSVSIVIIIAIPLIIGLFALSAPVVKILFEHGKFSKRAAENTILCLKYLVFSAFGYSLIDILSKVFFSIKDTVTPMVNDFIVIVLNIVLIVTLVPRFGIIGLALSTSISANVVALIMLIELKVKLKNIKYKKIIITFFKSVISAVIMGIIVNFIYANVDFVSIYTINTLIKILFSSSIGAIIYGAMLVVLRVEEVKEMLISKIFRRNLKKYDIQE